MTSSTRTTRKRAEIEPPGRNPLAVWFQTPAPGAWTRDSACSRLPGLAAAFTDASTLEEADAGLMICADCPVQLACLRYGQRLGADGVWGGQLLYRGHPRHRSIR